MFLLKEIGILAAGIFIGFTFATMMLYPQIQSRYSAGQNNAYGSGAVRIIDFLKTNFSQNIALPSKQPPVYLEMKGATIEIIERNGVRTLKVD